MGADNAELDIVAALTALWMHGVDVNVGEK
jgi:hypothetical protein